MPTRIDIELTSAAPDGSWTWRAAGARQPRGVLDGTILPGGASIGDQLRVETEKDLDGIRVLAVVPSKEPKSDRPDVLELLPTRDSFEPVTQQLVRGGRDDDRARRGPRRERNDRNDRGDRGARGDRRDRGSRDGGGGAGGGGDRPPSGDRPPRGDRPDGAARRDRPDRRTSDRDRRDGAAGGGGAGESRRAPRQGRPHFTPPPEVPQRPKPKRLRPGKQHRTDVLASLPEEQRPIADLAVQGLPAVRQRLREDNARLRQEGKPEMPEAAVMKMAEELLPRLRVAEWLDRADAAMRQMEHLDLRDLRSVVAAGDDPVVARDESTRQLATDLKAALATKQEEELRLWLGDVESALDVGRVVRALRLSSQPPKAGVPFPAALATRLGEATTAALAPLDAPDRWIAVLEAAAFSPVRTHVTPSAVAEARSDELLATVKRLGPLLPQIATLFGVEIPVKAHVPKPLRPTMRKDQPKRPPPPPPPPPKPEADAARRPEPEVAPDAAPEPEVDATPEADASPEAEAAPTAEMPAHEEAVAVESVTDGSDEDVAAETGAPEVAADSVTDGSDDGAPAGGPRAR